MDAGTKDGRTRTKDGRTKDAWTNVVCKIPLLARATIGYLVYKDKRR